MDVHVLIISHKHGENVSVHSTADKAQDELYEYICQWWGEWEDLPWDEENENDACFGMDTDKAIDMYFETAIEHGEGYEILQCTVDA